MVEAGSFRSDLLYRLNRLSIRIPALRERPDDILPLAEHFLAEGREDGRRPEIAALLGTSPDTVTRDLKVLLAEGLIEKVKPSASPRSHYFRLRSC